MKPSFIVVRVRHDSIGISVSCKTLQKYSNKFHVVITELGFERFIELSPNQLSPILLKRVLVFSYYELLN